MMSTSKDINGALLGNHCQEVIDFLMPDDLQQSLAGIPHLYPINLKSKKIKISELYRYFISITNLTVHTCDPELNTGLTTKQQIALEQCKLNIMRAIYDDILFKSEDRQNHEIVKILQQQKIKNGEEEAFQNAWWKIAIEKGAFWLWIIINLICDFKGLIDLMCAMLVIPVGTFNVFTLLFAIPCSLLCLTIYLAGEGTYYGFGLGGDKKQRIQLFKEQIELNHNINSLLQKEDFKDNLSANNYRNYASIAIQFNKNIQSKKEAFQPTESMWRKVLYWMLLGIGVLTTAVGGYYLASSLIAVFCVVSPVATWLIICSIILVFISLYVAVQLRADDGGIKAFIMPALEEENGLRKELDASYITDQAYYEAKIINKIFSEHELLFPAPDQPAFTQRQEEEAGLTAPEMEESKQGAGINIDEKWEQGEIVENISAKDVADNIKLVASPSKQTPSVHEKRIIEHAYNNAEGHRITRGRSRSLNFVPSLFHFPESFLEKLKSSKEKKESTESTSTQEEVYITLPRYPAQ